MNLDRLLGPGVVVARPDGRLVLDESAIAASLHHRQRLGGPRCFCAACESDRERSRIAAMGRYLAVLMAENPRDGEEIDRVRALMPRRPGKPSAQPWEPKTSRKSGFAGESERQRPAA